MSKIYSIVIFLGAGVILFGYQNCGPQGANGTLNNGQGVQPMQVNGTVKAMNLDGCTYVVDGTTQTGEAVQVIPMNLDPSLLIDGQAVSISGTIRGDLESSCQAGPIFQVDSSGGASLTERTLDTSGAASTKRPIPTQTGNGGTSFF